MKIVNSFNTWRNARRTAFELNQLSERNLEDLGMNRSEIVGISRDTSKYARLQRLY